MPETGIEWGSAEVSDGRLKVAFSDKPPKEWIERLERVLERLGHAGSAWGAVEVSRKKLQVDAVEPGVESDLRHFLESAVLQANAAERADDADDGGSARSERDQALTDVFRGFADRS